MSYFAYLGSPPIYADARALFVGGLGMLILKHFLLLAQYPFTFRYSNIATEGSYGTAQLLKQS